MPISQDIVNAQTVPDLVPELTYETTLAELIASLRLDLTAFEGLPDDILTKMAENTSDARVSLVDTLNRNGRQYFTLYATGDRLRAKALEYGLTQNPGESEAALRLRMFNLFESYSQVRLPAYLTKLDPTRV